MTEKLISAGDLAISLLEKAMRGDRYIDDKFNSICYVLSIDIAIMLLNQSGGN